MLAFTLLYKTNRRGRLSLQIDLRSCNRKVLCGTCLPLRRDSEKAVLVLLAVYRAVPNRINVSGRGLPQLAHQSGSSSARKN
eukprot:3904456-Rhodomonas_salina.2